MQYYTYNGFLNQFGNNLKHFYEEHFPMRDNLSPNVDNGPTVPVKWAYGSDETMMSNTPIAMKPYVETGYITVKCCYYLA